MVNGEAWWAIDVPQDADDPSYGSALDLFSYFGRSSEAEWIAAGRAVQLVEWARTHRFCGRCGSPTEPSAGERGMKCPACGLVAYPRVAPAMITLVTRGEPGPDQEALLAQGVNFRGPMYSCLAGFVEPGEDLEGAVVREVREEVGITVGNVQYVSSQPWPFPHSLMIGFRAEYAVGRPRAPAERDRRRQLVPARRPAADPAGDLDRPQTDRRLDRRSLNLPKLV